MPPLLGGVESDPLFLIAILAILLITAVGCWLHSIVLERADWIVWCAMLAIAAVVAVYSLNPGHGAAL